MGNKYINFVLVYKYFSAINCIRDSRMCINSKHIFASCAYDLLHMILLHITGMHLV